MKNIFKFGITLAVIIAFSVGPTAQAFTIGDRGTEVAELQAKLIESGYDIPLITSGQATLGYFGYQTQAALAASEGQSKTLKLGAAGGDYYGPQTSQNGVATIAARTAMRSATTTPCAFLMTATSSLSFFSLQVGSTSAQAATWTIATSTTYNSTSSPIATFPAISANAQASQMWNGVDRQLGNMSPGTYLVASVSGITGGSQGGFCQFEAKVF